MDFKIGDQIVYMPDHAKGDIKHPSVEFGFITGFPPGRKTAFCRYWSNWKPSVLRTTANSESTPLDMIQKYETRPPGIVKRLMKELGYET